MLCYPGSSVIGQRVHELTRDKSPRKESEGSEVPLQPPKLNHRAIYALIYSGTTDVLEEPTYFFIQKLAFNNKTLRRRENYD